LPIVPRILEAEISKSGKHAMHMGTITGTASATAVSTIESGLCAGTTVMTLDREVPVEHSSVGGRVITRDSSMSVIKAIHTRDVKMQPIRIKAGSLGHTRPDRDMMVFDREHILYADGVEVVSSAI
jgi:hypothetical protein